MPLCKELSDLYEHRLYDYTKLAGLLSQQAAAYTSILNTFRPQPEYFRVTFLGPGFPLYVRNKEFIYRGLNYEKLSEFTGRLLAEFPGAQVWSPGAGAGAQWLQVCSVRPARRDTTALYMGPTVPDNIKSFYSVNKVRARVDEYIITVPACRCPSSTTTVRSTVESAIQTTSS